MIAQEAIPCIMLGATIAAAAAAGFAFFTSRATKASITASNLVNCLNAYIMVMRSKRRALEEKNKELTKDFYRELFDLHWTEFQLWRKGMIPDNVMQAWLMIRHRNFAKGQLLFSAENGQQIVVSYSQVWQELKNEDYFEKTDPFLEFMNRVHEKVPTDIKTLRKEFEKK